MKRNLLIFLAVMSFLILQTIAPKMWGQEADLLGTKKGAEIQKVVQLRIKIRAEREKEILKRIGLGCETTENVENYELSGREVVCNGTVNQMNQLKQAGIEFEVEREGIRIENKNFQFEGKKQDKGVVWGENGTNYSIPYQDWVYSPITISSTPAGATVYSIDVHFEVIHTYVGDLAIDLTDEDLEHEYRLWDYDGGSQDNIDTTVEMIGFFIGELVNQTWKLYAWDCCEGDTGYIDYWWIQIWYKDPPDLIVQSLTASDYNPNVGDYIDVTMVIKNQGNGPAYGWFYSGLFYNLSSPPDIYTIENDWWSTDVLDSGETESHTFYNVYSSEPGTWHMYGLADCDGGVVESNEANNCKGPITINWIQPLPDLIVQSLTLDDDSLFITEHTSGTITIKNQGPGTVVDCFWTDVFRDTASTPSPPSPPATGEYFYEFCWLDSGETICYDFYKLPHSASSGTWRIWGLVDSWPNDWGNVQESNESNNVYGPVNITWLDPLSPHEVSRADMINHGLGFVNVNWTCSVDNVDPHFSCQTWTCDFSPGQDYTGEAYSWGGWDKPNTDFLTYLSAGLCAGSLPSTNCGQADAYWATGVDCSGLVSRCWELPSRRTTSSLVYVSDLITIQDLRSGDVMNDPGNHVMMFHEWVIEDSLMRVIEATPPQACTSRYSKDYLEAEGYVPRRYKWVYEPANNDPVIEGHIHCTYPLDECGDCIKLGEEMTIEIDAYDPDGDLLYYEWVSYFGHFVVDGETTYVDTTLENFISYLAPVDPWWPDDYLYVNVWDKRGGNAFIDAEFEAYEEGYSCPCGDANGTSEVDPGDPVYILNYLYKGQDPPPDPMLRGDANNNCEIDVGDAVRILNWLFQGGDYPECCWFPPEGQPVVEASR